MELTLKGQTAIVTGASSGIGTGVAIALAKAGARVIVNYSSQNFNRQPKLFFKILSMQAVRV